VDYIPEEPKRAAVRRLSRTVLEDQLTCWETVLDEVDRCLEAST